MEKKYIQDKDGVQVLPITHISAVRDDAGNTLDSILANDEQALLDESNRAKGAEQTLQNNINAETTRATAAEGNLNSTKANKATTLAGYGVTDAYTKSETYSKTELNNLITTPNQEYETYTATDQTTAVTDVLPATGEADTVYRVGNWDGTQYDVTCYTEYAWNGSAYVQLNIKEYGIDDEPTVNSNNLVKSGGVYESLKDFEDFEDAIIGKYNEVDINGADFTVGFLNNNGIIGPQTSWNVSDYIDIQNIDDVSQIEYYAVQNFNVGGGIGFYNLNKEFISGIFGSGDDSSTNSWATITKEQIPANTAYIVTCIYGTAEPSTVYIKIKNGNYSPGRLEETENKVQEIDDELGIKTLAISEIETYDVIGVSYMDGTTDINPNFRRLGKTEIGISKANLIEFKVFGDWANDSGYGGVQFFDENKNFISTIKYLHPGIWTASSENVPINEIPDNAVYFDVCCEKVYAEDAANQPLITIKYFKRVGGMAGDIKELQENCSNIEEEVDSIKNSTPTDTAIILPKKLFVKKNQLANIYFNQFVQSGLYDANYTVSQFIRDGVGGADISKSFMPAYQRQFCGTPSAKKEYPATYYLRRFNKLIDSWTGSIISTDVPSSAKSVKILNVGDSITDLGHYQRRLVELLYSDNITTEWIGTMDHMEYEHGTVNLEVLSGGNMSFITEDCGNAKILSVAGIITPPVTGYPGTSYLDENGNSWVVRGYKLSKQGDNTYSGLLKIGVFHSDPNYGDGTQGGSENNTAFPSSGTITKINSLPGDETITYTAVTEARFNPFWNPTSDELDFDYYFDFWQFDKPDIFLMQWAYNEVGEFDELNSITINTAVARAKTIIDKFHSQVPNAKIIFGFDPYGREIPPSYSSSNNDGKKYSVLNFEKRIIEEFDNETYSDFVIIVPTSALMDNYNGYGSIEEVSINPIYPNAKVVRQVDGYDGVHPPYNFGHQEIALAYEAAILDIV